MDKKSAKEEKKNILKRIDEIYRDYAINEDDEEVACVYMLFRHKDGQEQTKCLRFFNREDQETTGNAFSDLGLKSVSDYRETYEDIGLECLWKHIHGDVPNEETDI